MKIFLSHRSRDKPTVREFRDRLPRFLDTWLDEDSLSWGDSLPTELKSSIKSEVDFLIIFMDDEALRSEWVKQELDWALSREEELGRKFVLPILLGEITPEDHRPELINRLYLRLTDFSRKAVEDLADRATHELFRLVAESFSSQTKSTISQSRSTISQSNKRERLSDFHDQAKALKEKRDSARQEVVEILQGTTPKSATNEQGRTFSIGDRFPIPDTKWVTVANLEPIRNANVTHNFGEMCVVDEAGSLEIIGFVNESGNWRALLRYDCEQERGGTECANGTLFFMDL